MGCHQYVAIPTQATGTQRGGMVRKGEGSQVPTSVPPAVTLASRNTACLALCAPFWSSAFHMHLGKQLHPSSTRSCGRCANWAALIKCDACPVPQHSARTKHFSSCLRKSKFTEQKGNLEDYNCATRVSRENPSRLLCFSLSAFCTHLFVQSSVLVLKITPQQAALWEEELPPGPCCPEGIVC